MGKRTAAREVALQLLYQLDLLGGLTVEEWTRFLASCDEPPEVQGFAERLARGVQVHRALIDARIVAVAENWRLERMAVVDRNIIRLGAFEILHCPDVPGEVAIDEAVELAKRFSSKDSGAFVNGILDRIFHGQPAASTVPPKDAP